MISTVRGTIRDQWHVLRAEANEDATAIDLTTGGAYASKPAGAVKIHRLNSSSAHGTSMVIVACAGAAADKTFTITLYGWRLNNGMAQRLASIACVTGTHAVVTYPSGDTATLKFWADTATVTSYRGGSIYSNDGEGGNTTAEIVVLDEGFDYLYAQVSGADGVTGAEAGNVSLYYAMV